MADFATMAEAEIIFSESLEQLASYNGADMHEYNLIYTFKINQHVLTPESYDVGVKRYFAPNDTGLLRALHSRNPITQKNPCTLN